MLGLTIGVERNSTIPPRHDNSTLPIFFGGSVDERPPGWM